MPRCRRRTGCSQLRAEMLGNLPRWIDDLDVDDAAVPQERRRLTPQDVFAILFAWATLDPFIKGLQTQDVLEWARSMYVLAFVVAAYAMYDGPRD